MGYRCAIDEAHHEGAPKRVVTKRRGVQYIHDNGMSEGHETVQEILVHPDNVDVLGSPLFVGHKTVDNRSPKRRKRDAARDHRHGDGKDESYLQTWKEYRDERG